MKFFATAVTVGLALLQATTAASEPWVQRRDNALPAFRMPYPNMGKWKVHYDEDVKKYGHGGGPTMKYSEEPGSDSDSDPKTEDCNDKSPGKGGHGGSSPDGQFDSGSGGHGGGHGGQSDGKSGGRGGGHGGQSDGGHGGRGGKGGPVVVHDNNNSGSGRPAPSTNEQSISCSAGAPFCCAPDNGSGGQICSNNATVCSTTVICCNNNGGIQICIGEINSPGPVIINITQ